MLQSSFLELQRKDQENMVSFVKIELDLIATFVSVAGTTHEAENREHLLDYIQEALSTVRRFEGRIQDRKIWQEVHAEMDRLEAAAAIL
jgi:hypothetical protein